MEFLKFTFHEFCLKFPIAFVENFLETWVYNSQ